MRLSAPPVIICCPRTESAQTLSLCRSSVTSHSLLLSVHTLTSPSAPVEMSCDPEVRKLRASTDPLWPCRVLRHVRSVRDQTLSVRSPLHVAQLLFTGENAKPSTPRLWPRRVPDSERSEVAQSFTVLSCEQVATRESFGDTARWLMSFSCARTFICAVGLRGASIPTSSLESTFHFFSVRSPLAVKKNASPLAYADGRFENAAAVTP
mmetsp:Transcript_24786/g.55820  ORF Transcript_24786/g.55820 Transcript_24786/m.55820 type:complete len:208 (-) Transcript_24786:683-1306(-)